ncbi:MAG TPA: septum formation initiator [Stellaceae bacterium]|nr:septum formation initiator [Stellaceae bacterium]
MRIAQAAVAVFLLVGAAKAADPAHGLVPALPARVETRHTITLAGHPFTYRAVAETIGLVNPKGEPAAAIFVVSYLAGSAPTPAAERRPVAFFFNGGPGAASVFLQLGAAGPRILETPPDGAAPAPPFRLIDNPSTWLAFTDLVFVDPVGTGFSRAEGKGDNPGKPFWNVEGDLQSLGAVVRRWLDRHNRWGSPVFLVGESYGGLRAAALAQTLAEDVGVAASGLVLVSPALDPALLHPDISDTLAPAFLLPSEAASAAVFAGKSPIDAAAAAERFALSDYLLGLTRMAGIPAADDPLIRRVAALTGLPDWVVARERGRISAADFTHELRRPEHEILSSYDATVGRATGANPWSDRAGDPILRPAVAAFNAAFENYSINELGYRTEAPYRVLHDRVAEQWNWDAARSGEDGLGLALTALQQTLRSRPQTRVLIANGRYDLVTPYLASRWLVDQLGLPGALRADIRLGVYPGGHMMYMRPASRAALAADAAALFAAAVPPSAP